MARFAYRIFRSRPPGAALVALAAMPTLVACILFLRTPTAFGAVHATDAAPYAHRVITLAPHITELIFAAGGGDRIVATVSSSDYPPAARSIPRIGNGMQVSAERILSADPDLVAAWQPTGAARTLAPALATLHIPLVYVNPKKITDIPAQIRRFGRLLGTQDTAGYAAALLTDRLGRLRRTYAHRRPVSVFIEVGTEPLYTIGADPLLNDALDVCAGANIYADSPAAAPQVSKEAVLARQPDVVITSAASKPALQDRQRTWAALHLNAALDGQVYAIDPDELFRPGPRLIDAAEKLCQDLDKARHAG